MTYFGIRYFRNWVSKNISQSCCLMNSEQNSFNLSTATMAATKQLNVYRFLKVTSEV